MRGDMLRWKASCVYILGNVTLESMLLIADCRGVDMIEAAQREGRLVMASGPAGSL